MEAERLLEALRENSMARLRHAVLEKAGVPPFSLRAWLISNRRILRYACHLVLDEEQGKLQSGAGFDMERFLKMKEGSYGGV